MFIIAVLAGSEETGGSEETTTFSVVTGAGASEEVEGTVKVTEFSPCSPQEEHSTTVVVMGILVSSHPQSLAGTVMVVVSEASTTLEGMCGWTVL